MNETNIRKLKYIDLFCGIGSFHYSFKKNGWECVMACDILKSARDNYKHNYDMEPLGDIYDIDPKDIPEYDILTAGYPCFIAGTKILTETGYKNIENVTLDDKLLSHTGNFKQLINLQQKIYNGKLYNIKLMYRGETIICTEEHPFYIREKVSLWNNKLRKLEHTYKEPIWKTANEIKKNDYFGMIINDKNIIPNFTFDKSINKYTISTEKIVLDKLEMWFMMGYFIGDEWIQDCKKIDGRLCHTIRFAINNKDYDEVYHKISTILPITDKKCDSGKKCKKYGCSNFLWYNIFKQFGKYAHGKFIPEWIQDAPIEYIQEFINGYMKADGCILKNNIYQITTVSHDLAYGLQRLYLKLGHIFSVNKYIRSKTTIIEGRTVNQRDTYVIRSNINKKSCYSFIEDNYHWFPLKNINITNDIDIPVYNFEVENDNSYIVNNTIVHNCQPFSQCGKHKGLNDERGTLFFQVMKFVKANNPKIIVLENVAALLTHDKGNTFKIMLAELEKEGYTVVYKILKCSDYGIPQMRKRIFIVGFKNIKIENPEKFLDLDKYKKEVTLSKYLNQNFKKDTAYTIRCGGRHSAIDNRHNWDGYWVDDEEYRLTIEDGLKLQGFTENFSLIGSNTEKWKLLGNTIPTIFTEIIANQIREYCII